LGKCFNVFRGPLLSENFSTGFETPDYPGIFVPANGDPVVTNSVFSGGLEKIEPFAVVLCIGTQSAQARI
jgi:hypothetical protein